MSETSVEFTAEDLTRALSGDYDEMDTIKVPKYKVSEKHKDASWVVDGVVDSQWAAEKDENGFPVVARIDEVPYDGNEDLLTEFSSEFWYDGGFIPGLGYFRSVSNGNLGDGHEAWSIVQHQDSGRYFRADGWYSSWGDSSIDDGGIHEVWPVEQTIVRFRYVDNTVANDPVLDKV